MKLRSLGFLFLAAAMIMSFSTRNHPDAKIKSGEELLRKMYKTYSGKWYKNFVFTQETENYPNDTSIKKSTWHEAIVFPDYFRITFGDMKDGNAMLQVRDSAFNFRKGKLVRRTLKGEDLTFLLGGMYFIPFDSVKARMKREGYNYEKFHNETWQGKPVYVIGADAGEKANQLWIDAEKLVVVRFLRFKGKEKEEAIFGDHKAFGKAWSETSCLFYINDKLIQKETYTDCKANTDVDMGMFDPYNLQY